MHRPWETVHLASITADLELQPSSATKFPVPHQPHNIAASIDVAISARRDDKKNATCVEEILKIWFPEECPIHYECFSSAHTYIGTHDNYWTLTSLNLMVQYRSILDIYWSLIVGREGCALWLNAIFRIAISNLFVQNPTSWWWYNFIANLKCNL